MNSRSIPAALPARPAVSLSVGVAHAVSSSSASSAPAVANLTIVGSLHLAKAGRVLAVCSHDADVAGVYIDPGAVIDARPVASVSHLTH